MFPVQVKKPVQLVVRNHVTAHVHPLHLPAHNAVVSQQLLEPVILQHFGYELYKSVFGQFWSACSALVGGASFLLCFPLFFYSLIIHICIQSDGKRSGLEHFVQSV